jgi:hypothetical protein
LRVGFSVGGFFKEERLFTRMDGATERVWDGIPWEPKTRLKPSGNWFFSMKT